MNRQVNDESGVEPRMDVTFEELRRLVAVPGTILVDVLSRASYDEAHIEGAISLPLAEIPARAAGLLTDRDRTIVVYCGSYT